MTMKPLVLADPLPPLFFELAGDRFDIRALEPDGSVDETRVTAIVTYGHPVIDGPVMDRFPGLKVISNHGVGVDHIHLPAAAERNIPVGNTPGCLDASTADMTMALLLAVARNVVIGDHFARGPQFTHYDPSVLIGQEVTGSTLGIIGMGRIGAQVAKRAAAFDMKVLYHNRNRRTDLEAALGVEYRSLPELLSESDFVSLNCPLTKDTRGLIGSAELALMKRSGILINMARGPVVQTDALLEALKQRTIAAAGLDVTDPEPLPRDHELLTLDNLVIAPHLGSASNGTRRRMMEITVLNLIAGLDGRPLPFRVG